MRMMMSKVKLINRQFGNYLWMQRLRIREKNGCFIHESQHAEYKRLSKDPDFSESGYHLLAVITAQVKIPGRSITRHSFYVPRHLCCLQGTSSRRSLQFPRGFISEIWGDSAEVTLHHTSDSLDADKNENVLLMTLCGCNTLAHMCQKCDRFSQLQKGEVLPICMGARFILQTEADVATQLCKGTHIPTDKDVWMFRHSCIMKLEHIAYGKPLHPWEYHNFEVGASDRTFATIESYQMPSSRGLF